MHSRYVSVSAIAVISFLPILWTNDANAVDRFGIQEVLVDCPTWEWQPSPLPDVDYEICFDDVGHCTAAEIGDAVCIPSLGVHAVWVTAIYHQSGEPIYFDGDIALIERVESADFTGDGLVGMGDLGIFSHLFGDRNGSAADLDRDGIVGFTDFAQFLRAFGKCVNPSGTVYEPCRA